MLTGRRFVIAGLSHLTVRVATTLADQHAEVCVIGDAEHVRDGHEILDELDDRIRFVATGHDRDQALLDAGVDRADGFLAVADADLDNYRFVADAHELVPGLPVVLRTFQPELADHLAGGLNIRRAYSVAALAAPAFVAASVAEEVVETLRLGDDEIPLCVVHAHATSVLVGASASDVESRTGSVVVAVRSNGADWRLPEDGVVFGVGDQLLVGGRHHDVLGLALDNDRAGATARPDDRARTEPTHRRRGWRWWGVARRERGRREPTILSITTTIFAIVFVLTMIVNAWHFGLNVTDAATSAVMAALGNSPAPTDSEAIKLFDLAATVAGFVLVWVLLSHLTALVLAERLQERMTRRARRLHDHVIVVGLGKVGYRVVQLLEELGVPTVAIERDPDSRFSEAIAVHTPVLTGDGQLPENLDRCGVQRARCIIACTEDDLANLATCLEARGRHPGIRTVTRAFDEQLTSRLQTAFQIDRAISSTALAASAFVGAAADDLAARTIELEGLELLAFRLHPEARIDAARQAAWAARGVRILAVQDGRAAASAAGSVDAIEADTEVIVIGPAAEVRTLTGV